MFARGARFFSAQAQQRRPTKVIESLLEQHGPQTVQNCWKLAEPEGIPSKTRMKSLLRWLVDQNRVQKTCNPLKQVVQQKGGNRQKTGSHAREFLFTVRPWQRKRKKWSPEETVSASTGENAPTSATETVV